MCYSASTGCWPTFIPCSSSIRFCFRSISSSLPDVNHQLDLVTSSVSQRAPGRRTSKAEWVVTGHLRERQDSLSAHYKIELDRLALRRLLTQHTDLLFLGEDIEDGNEFTPGPYGGAFKAGYRVSIQGACATRRSRDFDAVTSADVEAYLSQGTSCME
jgi:hypothetical protein